MFQNFFDGAPFKDFPIMHHHHIIGNLGNNAKIVSDKHHTHAGFLLELAQQFQNFFLNCYIKSGCGLVSYKDLGIAGYGHGNHHALFLSPAEFMGVAVVNSFRPRQHHLMEQRDHPVVSDLLCHFLVLTNHLGNLMATTVHRIQRGHRFLKNHGDTLAPNLGHLSLIEVLDIHPL